MFKPYKTPAILGGAFIASKKFLREIDYFGRGMEGWGYENIELTMKVHETFKLYSGTKIHIYKKLTQMIALSNFSSMDLRLKT